MLLLVHKSGVVSRLFAQSLKKPLSTAAWPTEAKALVYASNGDPRTVLKQTSVPLPQQLQSDEIRLKFLQAPINPSDVNMVQGVYDVRPPLPAVGGNEGVAVVVDVGADVKDVKVNDWVIPYRPSAGAFGTWRTHAVAKATEVQVVPSDIHVSAAATISINPCTAYRLLEDFAKLNPGDVIVQNGANSAVGQCVIQLAKLRGVHTINFIRPRPEEEYTETVELLKALGGTIVVDESYARTQAMRELMAEAKFPGAKLGLNCIGGESASLLNQYLGMDAKLVTYGGMSKKPVTMSTSQQLFKNVEMHGFWLNRWVADNSKSKWTEMIHSVADLVRKDQLKTWVEIHNFSRWSAAVDRHMEPYRGRKVVFDMDN
eukprot:TRINITY_DN1165_c0_g1_i1.p1 TRINITY_DN1165_c0_g1~~TRINITY_DN1165_c0_g1_i1.p1  ORF type:complete len:372 (-),score=84.65 TRINITY_DN1165_c0_g1_i1:314-1429(-)